MSTQETNSQGNNQKKRRKKRKSKNNALNWLTWQLIKTTTIRLGILFCVGVIGYMVMALVGVLYPVNENYQVSKQGIPIYIVSNGFHTDYVVPVRNEHQDWLSKFQDSTYTQKYQNFSHISFGWGDEDFYMASYNDNFPSIFTIINALFFPSNTLIHLEFVKNKPVENNKDCIRIILTPEQYINLMKYIEMSFKVSVGTSFIKKDVPGYGQSDYFYHAKGEYHLFNTCNDWINSGFKWIGIKASGRAPFAESVLYHYKQ